MREKIITFILTIIITAVPIAILPDAKQYNMAKIYILVACGAILLIFTLLNHKKIKLDKKDYLILIFGGLVLLSTIFSTNIDRSIIGSRNRYEGILAIFTYILIYLCAKKFMKYKNKKTLLVIIHIVYILISILGIFQHYIKMPTNDYIPIFNKNVAGTFGNTNFMGNFVSMGIPIFVILYIIKGNKISFITSLLVFFNLIACYARSGWVAFIAFSIILLIYLIKNRKMTYFIRAIILAVCFSIIFSSIYLEKNSMVKSKIADVKKDVELIQNEMNSEEEKKENENTTGQTSISKIEKNVGSGRIQIWKIVLELIQKYPLLGVGTDNLANGICYNATETSIDFMTRTGTIPDKAHNEYLHIAVTIGIPAMIIYLIFISSTILPKLKRMFNEESVFILGSVIISYLVQAFFNISTIGVAPLFWVALGLIDNKWQIE